jgi:hypothetical protein
VILTSNSIKSKTPEIVRRLSAFAPPQELVSYSDHSDLQSYEYTMSLSPSSMSALRVACARASLQTAPLIVRSVVARSMPTIATYATRPFSARSQPRLPFVSSLSYQSQRSLWLSRSSSSHWKSPFRLRSNHYHNLITKTLTPEERWAFDDLKKRLTERLNGDGRLAKRMAEGVEGEPTLG